jgi:hypothetical protein
MKFDPKTLKVLKNFSSINMSIIFREGNVLSTRSPSNSILAFADIPDTIPRDCAVYDLPKLLTLLSLMDDPQIEFLARDLVIVSGTSKVHYRYTDIANVQRDDKPIPTRDKIRFPEPITTFELTEDTFTRLKKGMDVMQFPNLVVKGEDGFLKLVGCNVGMDSGNKFDVEIGETDKTFRAVFLAENLKMMPGNYMVSIAQQFAHFKGEGLDYYIAVEAPKKR